MENERLLRTSMDDIVFDGRNKSYGAFELRRLYDKHMTRAMMVGILFFLLVVGSPQIIKMIKGFVGDNKEKLVMKEVTLAEPPPIDPKKPPPPPPPKVDPPPIKDQIKFVPPVVKKDEEVKEEEPPPPTVEEIKDKEIATETKEGDESGVDASLAEPEAPAAPVLEEPKDEEPFTFVEQMPTFPDGTEAMYKYINGQIKYPAIARENGISGQVIVQFVVSKEGDISKAHVVRGIGGGCNEEALRVVNGMPKWKAGKHNGRAVPVTFTLPIKFVLQ
ncbi:MAG: energy transducer TonB [Saprospiraceae bacterium]